MDHSYPYIASLTREPFLFYEMRSTAKLMAEGNSDDTIVKEIVEQNLFQYPTEKSITRMAKARLRDTSFGKIDLNTFFMRLQEQNDTVASWSDATITKLKQIIARVLVETEYLDNLKADHLNPVWLYPVLENAIRSNGDTEVLPAFNCFSYT